MTFQLGEGFLKSLTSARGSEFTHLEDFADRLSHFFSSGFLLMFAGVTMANVYFLRPISCTLSTPPNNKFIEFMESMCWVEGTIALSDDEKTPQDWDAWNVIRQRSNISFYQWVPFCLSIQAMLFFLPHAIWQSLAANTLGENLESILIKARDAENATDNEKRQKCVEAAAYQLFRMSRQHRDNRSTRWARWQRYASTLPGGSIFIASKRMGNWAMLAYLAVKVLYLCNAIGQLYIIRTFLGYDGSLLEFGNALIGTLSKKREWMGSEFFPRQTYCPVKMRHLGDNKIVYTAMCALPVNMFNEKIYIFLWLWIAMVTVATAFSLLIWLIRASWQSFQYQFVSDFLLLSLETTSYVPGRKHLDSCAHCHVMKDDVGLNRFIREFVRNDGAFLLRMIRSNAGDVVCGEVLSRWWHMFVEFEEAECAHISDSEPGKKESKPYTEKKLNKKPQRMRLDAADKKVSGYSPRSPNISSPFSL